MSQTAQVVVAADTRLIPARTKPFSISARTRSWHAARVDAVAARSFRNGPAVSTIFCRHRLARECRVPALAVSSRQRALAEEYAATFGILHAFDDEQALITHPDVDLVVILTPGPEHARLARAAIAAGKDVYSEWPLSTRTSDSEELLSLAEAKGVRHVVGLQRRLGPGSRYMRDLVRQGYVGSIRSARMTVSVDTIAETGQKIPSTRPDQVMMIGALADGGLFSIQIEGGQQHRTGLQIDITGTDGVLRITNPRAFENKDDNAIEGVHGSGASLSQLPVPAEYRSLAVSHLDASVQDVAYLYDAYARDRRNGTSDASSFRDALRQHQFIDQIEQTSEDFFK